MSPQEAASHSAGALASAVLGHHEAAEAHLDALLNAEREAYLFAAAASWTTSACRQAGIILPPGISARPLIDDEQSPAERGAIQFIAAIMNRDTDTAASLFQAAAVNDALEEFLGHVLGVAVATVRGT